MATDLTMTSQGTFDRTTVDVEAALPAAWDDSDTAAYGLIFAMQDRARASWPHLGRITVLIPHDDVLDWLDAVRAACDAVEHAHDARTVLDVDATVSPLRGA